LAFEGTYTLPQRVVCEKCATILYQGKDLAPPDEVIQRHNGKCPTCGKKLSITPKDVDVKPA
jgi:hypothetical protein